ncbi:MAG: hypothetical protein ACTSW1_00775 [Candidatus Hodarchaeales archaeon]
MSNWKKICLVVIFSILFTCQLQPLSSKNTISASPSQDSFEDNVAGTDVNVTLSDSTTLYERTTFLPNPETDVLMQRFFVLAKLTTHGDLLVQFDVEFLSSANPDWDGNFTFFENSSDALYFKNYQALRDMVNVNISLLDISSSSIEIFEDNRTDPRGGTDLYFVVEQRVIIRETTAFLLVLPEPFQFGLNKLELGQLSELHFQFEYVNFTGEAPFVTESVRLKAPGSALDYIPNLKGYSGTLYLAEFPYEAQPIPRFLRPYADAPQDIMLKIKLPIGQNEINLEFDSTFLKNADIGSSDIRKTKNLVQIYFDHDSYLPYSITINSVTPFLEQFSFSDYISMSAGVLAALFTVLKGLPYFYSRRSFNKFKSSLFDAVKKEEWQKLDAFEQEAKSRFMSRKLTATQYEEVNKVIQMLRNSESPVAREKTTIEHTEE